MKTLSNRVRLVLLALMALSLNAVVSAATLFAQTSIGNSNFVNVSVKVTNTSQRAGAEVVELYATPSSLCPSPSTEPKQKLVGFQRCWFQPGQAQSVTIPMNLQNLRRWDDPTHQYIIDPGTYVIYARSSSNTPDTQSASGRLTLAAE